MGYAETTSTSAILTASATAVLPIRTLTFNLLTLQDHVYGFNRAHARAYTTAFAITIVYNGEPLRSPAYNIIWAVEPAYTTLYTPPSINTIYNPTPQPRPNRGVNENS
jgi:hypothetical protein